MRGKLEAGHILKRKKTMGIRMNWNSQFCTKIQIDDELRSRNCDRD